MTINDTFWLAAKRKGFVRFIVETGFPFSLVMFIATGVIYDQFGDGFLNFNVLKYMLVWLVGGAFFGIYQWYNLKRRASREV
ncbi:TPA: hypothetical protein NGU48_004643 [Vibrio parahaemolyticus]|uniref:hypothetical protein n=1 Tax=Vibrio parahaemolyticus TaxID=670 RepID=UPI0011220BB4|nr:hypothetical protein [Vibrio parahaemolyticus]MBE4295982.1 hypothetical protein [Vibrio parahaemolyticus]MBE4318510.1 hypothetical protein [Vibrio parahaemolyticus]MCG6505685.1 hypothetical protein [Vibrio parahaemolyticus]TOI34264.1 hypothetical protein CGI61_23590 [Vibrio parahaemolyticus]HCE2112514.1 hypothetical protein [Vibrio parahaemolyticus]